MPLIEQIGAYVLATVLQLPLHLAIASPWLLLAWAIVVFFKQRLNANWRVILASAAAAIGLAPLYGAHLSVIPAYTQVGTASVLSVAVSVLLTWLLIFTVARAISNRRQHASA